jgi:DNA-binding LytR/AlgR family response regulator
MNALIVEDDLIVAKHISSILEKNDIKVIGIASNIQSSLKIIEANDVEIVILDIKLANNDNGIEISKTLNSLGIPFIYITANSDYNTLLKAGESEPKSYITKPFNEIDVIAAVTLIKVQKSINEGFIEVHYKGGRKKIPFKDIMYIKSSNVYVDIVTKDKSYTERKALKKIETELPEKKFKRIHKSYIVNIDYIDVKKTNSVVIGSSEIPISKFYKSKFNF